MLTAAEALQLATEADFKASQIIRSALQAVEESARKGGRYTNVILGSSDAEYMRTLGYKVDVDSAGLHSVSTVSW